MRNKTVYIIAGANGSGKTTFAKEFIKIPNIAFLNADEIEREFNPDDKEGGHKIPTKDIIRRYPRSINNFWNIYKDLTDEWQLFYNGEDNVIQTALGYKNNYKIIDEEKFKLFKRGFDA